MDNNASYNIKTDKITAKKNSAEYYHERGHQILHKKVPIYNFLQECFLFMFLCSVAFNYNHKEVWFILWFGMIAFDECHAQWNVKRKC